MWTFCEQVLQDLRFALRMTVAKPAFTAMAVVSLALGIGANTAIYSFMDAILMRSLPVPNPQSLVTMNWRAKDFPAIAHSFSGNNYRDPKLGFVSRNFPYPAFELLRANHPTLASIFAFNNAGPLNVLIRGQADLAQGQYVSGEYFSGLGLGPAAGRLIVNADDRPGAPAVAVVSFTYARKRFGDVTLAPGQTALLNNVPFTIVGVAPPEFFGPNPETAQEVYLPMRSSALLDAATSPTPNAKYEERNFYWVEMMARLQPGVSMAQSQAALGPLFQGYVASTATNDKERADLPAMVVREGSGGLDSLRRSYSKPLYILMAFVGLILAIACANIANLLLARATARRREMAVRLSLGAGRVRVVRQLLTESLLLASMGGALGVFFAHWGILLLTFVIAGDRTDFNVQAELNWHVLGITLALSVATGLLFGLAPALQATGIDLTPALKQSRGAGHGQGRRSFLRVSASQVLVVAQIAISMLLLVGAGLFVRTLSNLHSLQLGFNQENLLLFSVNAKQAGYQDESLAHFYDSLQSRLATLPGVRNVTLSNFSLVSGMMSNTNIKIPGRPVQKEPSTSYMSVGPSFFTTMQIPILLGREIEARDQAGTPRVAVVNEIFVKQYLGDENPVGRHFTFGFGRNAVDIEIAGVSRNARYQSLKQDLTAVAYFPYSQDLKRLGQMSFEVRAVGDPLALTNSVRQVVHEADARIPVAGMMTQRAQIDRGIAPERTFATLCTAFAILAMLIAAVGLYGTMAYNVARRTSEIGLRMALGAERPRVVRMILREVLLLAAAGLGIGLPAAVVSARLLESFLFRMKANDPLTLSLAAGVLLVSAIAAGFAPAHRASRIDPMVALRQE